MNIGRTMHRRHGSPVRVITPRVRASAVLLASLSAASCSTHANSISVADRLATPIDARCAQDVIRALPGNRPSANPQQWYTDVRASGQLFSSYAFGLPDIADLPGPTGGALYWVNLSDEWTLFASDERHGYLRTSVMWQEPYPESDARGLQLQDSLATVRTKLLDRCGSALLDVPTCTQTYADGLTSLEKPCRRALAPAQLQRSVRDGAAADGPPDTATED